MKNKQVKTIYLVLIVLCSLCFAFSTFVTVLAIIAKNNNRVDGSEMWLSLVAAILMLGLLIYLVIDFIRLSKMMKTEQTGEAKSDQIETDGVEENDGQDTQSQDENEEKSSAVQPFETITTEEETVESDEQNA